MAHVLATPAGVALSLATGLLPIAYYYGKSCFNKLRSPLQIKKSLLILPNKGGKTMLKAKLNKNNSNLLIVDIDEFVSNIVSPDEWLRIKKLGSSLDTIAEFNLFYKDACNKLYDKFRELCRKDKHLRVLFVTSCVSVLELSKLESSYIAAPDDDFFDEIVKTMSPEEDRDLRMKREMWKKQLSHLQKAISTYHSYDELEKMVRERFEIGYRF